MLKLKYVLSAVLLVLLSLQAWMFTRNDIYSLLLVLLTSLIMFNVILELQAGNKKVLRVNTKEGSFLHTFLSKDKTIFMKLLAFLASFFMAFLLVLILKGIVNSHGIIAFTVIIMIISLSLFSVINNKNAGKNSTIDSELATDLANHANNFINVLSLAAMLNIALSMVLSAHDVMMFLNNNITFSNFDEFASKAAVIENDNNHISRNLMNLYILMDYFKLASASQIMILFGVDLSDKQNYFYLFYLLVFFMNMLKLFAFSLSFVFLQKGLEQFSIRLMPFIQGFINKSKKFNKAHKERKSKSSNKADEFLEDSNKSEKNKGTNNE